MRERIVNQLKCRKCGLIMEKDNIVEVFAYDRWRICDKCEKLFHQLVEEFFDPNIRK